MNNLRFCPPSVLFLLFSLLLFCIGARGITSMIIHHVVFLWTFLLEYLCENKLVAMSWLLLVMPLVLIFFFLLAYMYLLKHSTPVLQN